MAILRISGQCFAQCSGDALAELGSGGAGEGDDQHPLKRGRCVRIGQHTDDALGQHGRLARSGGGRDQERLAAGLNGRALLGSPVACHDNLRIVV